MKIFDNKRKYKVNFLIRYFLLLSIILFSSFINITYAQDALSLKDAIKFGFENNNELKAFKYSVSSENRDIAIERSTLLPRIAMEEVFTSTNGPVDRFALKANQSIATANDLAVDTINHPPPANNWLSAVTLEQAILDRRASINIRIAKTQYSLASFDYFRKRDEIAASIARAYFDVDRDQKMLIAAEKDIENAQENLNAVQYLFKNNKAYYSAVLRAMTELTNSKQSLVNAKKNLDVSKRALGLVLGQEKSVGIIEDSHQEPDLKDISYYNLNSKSRNDLKAEELRYKNFENQIKLAEAGYFPKIGLISSYRLYDNRAPFALEGHNYIATGFIRWDAFDGLKRKNEKLKAQDNAKEAWENLDLLKKRISFDVYSAYVKVEASMQNMRLSMESLKSAQDGRDIVLTKYKNLQLKLVDLLDTQANLNLARRNNIVQKNNYIDDLIDLSFQSGTILQDLDISE